MLNNRFGAAFLLLLLLLPNLLGTIRYKKAGYFFLSLLGSAILLAIAAAIIFAEPSPYSGFDSLGHGLARGILLILSGLVVSLTHMIVLIIIEIGRLKKQNSKIQTSKRLPVWLSIFILMFIVQCVVLVGLFL